MESDAARIPRTAFFVSILLFLCAGCAAQNAAVPGRKTRVVIDASISEHVVPAWLAYAGMRDRWMTRTYWEQNPGALEYRYTFAEEAAAREACARVWIELREFHKAKPDLYLDQLIEVFKAGYIPEYTWVYFRDERWFQPETLRLSQFESWRRANLQSHNPVTKAIVQFESPKKEK